LAIVGAEFFQSTEGRRTKQCYLKINNTANQLASKLIVSRKKAN